MKLNIYILLLSFIINSCNGQEKEKLITNNSKEKITTQITDTIISGNKIISNRKFIDDIRDGGDNYKYFYNFENILKNWNKKFKSNKPNSIVQRIELNESLTLEFFREPSASIIKDIQIKCNLYVDSIKTDSIIFYKYQFDANVQDDEQRLEVLSYIDPNFNLYNLQTYSNMSEMATEVGSWKKWKIDTISGKFINIDNFITTEYWEFRYGKK